MNGWEEQTARGVNPQKRKLLFPKPQIDNCIANEVFTFCAFLMGIRGARNGKTKYVRQSEFLEKKRLIRSGT